MDALTGNGKGRVGEAPGTRATPRSPGPRPPLVVERAPEPVALDDDRFYLRRGKRLASFAILLLSAPLALPLLALLAAANALWFRDPRLAFYGQERVGHRGRVFRIWKLRTMRAGTGSPEDRVTAFGRLLRVTHLDELPQLWNVLRGDMVFVGPRPEMLGLHHWATATLPGFEERLRVPPGLTGLAQVTLGYAEPEAEAYRRKLAADRRYLEHLSPRLDAWILWRTLLWMLGIRGRRPGGRGRG